MAHLNHKGPEEEGPKTGRKLGQCRLREGENPIMPLGKGMGLHKNNSGQACLNKGKRIKASHLLTK